MFEKFDLIKVSRTRDNLIFITQSMCVGLRQLVSNTCAPYCSNSKTTIWRGNMNARTHNVKGLIKAKSLVLRMARDNPDRGLQKYIILFEFQQLVKKFFS